MLIFGARLKNRQLVNHKKLIKFLNSLIPDSFLAKNQQTSKLLDVIKRTFFVKLLFAGFMEFSVSINQQSLNLGHLFCKG